MSKLEDTVRKIVDATSWDQRVAQIRLVAQAHGTAEHQQIFADVAREAYVPHLAPDFAYVHSMDYYELPTFQVAYRAARDATDGFTDISEETLSKAIRDEPRSLLALRTITGLSNQRAGERHPARGRAARTQARLWWTHQGDGAERHPADSSTRQGARPDDPRRDGRHAVR